MPVITDKKIRYTVPQVITEPKDVTVYFRVSDVFKNAKINIYSNKGLILSKKKQRLAPGEMETVNLKAEMIEGAGELRFELEVL